MAEGCDWSWARPGGAALTAAGKTVAGRYLYPGGGKGLTLGEQADLQHYGMAIFYIYEGSGTDASSYANGVADAQLAQGQAAALGYPGAVIYFAVDEPIAPDLTDYLRGVNAVIGIGRTGIYGGLDTVNAAKASGLCTWFFQTYAWSRGQVAPFVHVYQYLNGQDINGSVDFLRTLQANFGQISGNPAPSSPASSGGASLGVVSAPGVSVQQVQAALDAHGYALVEDNIMGPATTAAIRDFQSKNGLTVDANVGPLTWAKLSGGAAATPVGQTVAGGTLKIGETDLAPAFPLPAGWYFGPASGPQQSVSGYYSHNADLKVWQARMAARGWAISVDGYYGPQTQAVARAFQSQKGLTVDGLIGPVTWGAAWTTPVTP